MIIKINKKRINEFTKIISSISKLSYELQINFNKDGLDLHGFDMANVAAFMLKLDTSFFDEYNIESEEKVGLNLEDFSKMLKKCKNDILIEKNENLVILKSGKIKYELTMIDVSREEKAWPSMVLNSSFSMETKQLKEILEDAIICHNSVIINPTKDKLVFRANGHLNKYLIELDAVIIKESMGCYSLEYLNKILIDIFDTVQISLDEDRPCVFEYKSAGIDLKFMLAPRIEE
jgi:proliferating cell nuclear antigen